MSHRNLYAKLDADELAYVLGLELACAVPDPQHDANAIRQSPEVPEVHVTLPVTDIEWSQIEKHVSDNEAMRAAMSQELQLTRQRLFNLIAAARNFLAEFMYNYEQMPQHCFRGEFFREWEDFEQLIQRLGQTTL